MCAFVSARLYVGIFRQGGQKALNQPELGPSDPYFCCGKKKGIVIRIRLKRAADVTDLWVGWA